MKTALRLAAVISFLAFFVGGISILRPALGSPAHDAFAIAAIGWFFIGTAFFVGPMLCITAERLGIGDGEK